jgi:uncharacterized protein UPF0158
MTIPVSLQDIVGELSILTDDATAYLNRRTGEVYTLTSEEINQVEDEDDQEDLPDWQLELLSKVREILDSEDWLPLPNKFEIHEYSIMEDFCWSVDDAELKEKLLNAIRGRGAFRYFKDTIHRQGIEEKWYRYREEAFAKVAIDWLEKNQIAYRRES